FITPGGNHRPGEQEVGGSLINFDGRASEWLRFKKIFERTQARFSQEENLARLDKALQGVAREAVSALLMSAVDPNQVMSSLETRFGRPEFIVLQQLSILRSLPRLALQESARDLNVFACRIRNCVASMSTWPLRNSPILWADFASTQESGNLNLELLADFLDTESTKLLKFGLVYANDFGENRDGQANVKNQIISVAKQPAKVYTTSSKSTIECSYCMDKTHVVTDCEKFMSLSIDDRWRWAKKNKVCFRCLTKGVHKYRRCEKSCQVVGCQYSRMHNTLLHPVSTETLHTTITELTDQPAQTASQHKKEPVVTIVSHSSHPTEQRPLLKVIPVSISGSLGSIDTFALLDDGATASFIDQSVADTIGAIGPKEPIRVNCIGGLTKDLEVSFVNIMVKGRHSSDIHKLTVRSIPNLAITSQSASSERITDVIHTEGK
ncbi:reverse transcriptase, partial [Operophtera brumata]